MRNVCFVLFVVASILVGCAAPGNAPTVTVALASPPTATAARPTPTSAAPTSTAVIPSPTVAGPTATAPIPTPIPTPLPSPTVASAFPLTVIDDAGRKVTLDRRPERIVSLSPGHTETLYALGAGDRLVVADLFSTFPAEAKPKAKLNTFPNPNVEELVSLKPDLILVLVEGDDFIKQMDAHQIKVLKLFPTTVDGTFHDIQLIGDVTGTSTRAQSIVAAMKEKQTSIVARTKDAPRPRILYELDASDPTKPWVAGGAGFYGALVPLAGGKNVFDDLTMPAEQVSTEQIIARDPEIVLLSDATSPVNAQTPAMVLARPGWSKIAAVKSKKIVPVDPDVLTRPGPRLIDGLEALARVIHPEIFR